MAEAYDASEVDERPRSAYFSRKDVRVLSLVGLLLIALLMPVYWLMMENRNKYVCKTNLGQVFKAMGTYLEQNDNRYPPAFVVGAGGEPNLFPESNPKYPYTWMSLIHEGMGERYSFNCPEAGEDETVRNLHPNAAGTPFLSSYGMYIPWSTYNSTMVVNPNTSILIAETSNHGSNETYDPRPFSHGVDGLVIGWDDGNDEATPKSQFITRLAFPESKGGRFIKGGRGRHGDGIHVLYASGQLGFVHPVAAELQRIGTEIVGRWATR